ncbi:P-type conjugative transfer protein TrbJ [Sphingomonas sp. CL5.1]|uniref:P-type conjugative transfer protein TrbJ n=1 Tax=Sphingomonas sp. CL5.1 TaxID=2653203 RepID=UPI00158257BE|nr:P-type conjugative transfer protein TrbJ [Sphingomonas sp. CL5.1]QKR98315.1 P-type conjugative transfer protein TrbJ [Sphingomonas sp. CL5.1]
MKIRSFRPLLSGAAAMALVLAAPADAQFGGIVYDPSNYAQNVLTAARALSQINNQITQIQNQAQSLINQARNLASLPTSILAPIQRDIDRTRQLIQQAQQVAYNVSDIDRVFNQRYPAGSLSGTSSADLVANAQARWHDALAAYQDTLRTSATVAGNLDDTRAHVGTLVDASQSSTGALQAAQAGNQLIALETRQLADLTTMLAAQARSASIAAARAAADEAQGREQARRFSRAGSPYVAQSVSLFRD